MNRRQIFEQIRQKQSFLCIGLDSDINKIPQHLRKQKNSLFEFNKQIIDATAQYCISYKPNLAFYEACGEDGLRQLAMTVEYLKAGYPDMFLIADAKRGDIGNTSQMYAQAFFEKMKFDAVTLSPYMGEDTVKPFLSFADKWIVLLALTSNASASDFQTVKTESGKMFYEEIILQSKNWGNANNTMYVVGATKAEMLVSIREILPHHFLLVPGTGAQGGNLADVAKYGMNDTCGLLVNSSRAIIYADSNENFAVAAAKKAKELQTEMAALLVKYKIIQSEV
ncbi:MAG: orotidine-5'-phosphate decarboxylase [Prevotellaceae bacterium]|jgi:orotidine-5'-phosphate decarboxylase|nr:orotidine-5'-phosphate decarboxylase [Prevotellaceae bacterium]